VKDLDPRNPLSKKDIKASITDAITKEVAGSNRDDVAQRVEVEYEKLLVAAHIFTHIPSLTAGRVRRDVVANSMRRGALSERDVILHEASLKPANTTLT
jgi:hypothetical protein